MRLPFAEIQLETGTSGDRSDIQHDYAAVDRSGLALDIDCRSKQGYVNVQSTPGRHLNNRNPKQSDHGEASSHVISPSCQTLSPMNANPNAGRVDSESNGLRVQ